ncbi:hypothetical protein RB12427 [Rhodopirellula baltica SH 1]|uniref:Uncharacterized protein n=1 Tax=Rhodopirellula baltica (strain DSM 10527 / NCIMB 13988 / SH1) TaxID=243090 RepID=Q7UIN5_RHOBA|nr:hypothetical protein RB12427 [Rhodopirellula baltica SH 1]
MFVQTCRTLEVSSIHGRRRRPILVRGRGNIRRHSVVASNMIRKRSQPPHPQRAIEI